MPRRLRLSALLKSAGLKAVAGDAGLSGIGLDSRAVGRGWIFCALPSASGQHADAFAHVRQALAKGVAAVLASPSLLKAVGPLGQAIAVPSADPRRDAAQLAAAFELHPMRRLRLSGITGTNGKTSVACPLHSLLTGAGSGPCALNGTVG